MSINPNITPSDLTVGPSYGRTANVEPLEVPDTVVVELTRADAAWLNVLITASLTDNPAACARINAALRAAFLGQNGQ